MLFEAHALLPEPSKKSMVSLEHSLWRLNVYAHVQPTSLKSTRHARVCVLLGVCVYVCVCVCGFDVGFWEMYDLISCPRRFVRRPLTLGCNYRCRRVCVCVCVCAC